VWLQLLERCAADPCSQPVVMRCLLHKVAEQKDVMDRQQQLITDLQEQLSTQQRAASKQISGLQGQLLELRAAVQ
jgi:small-conductance mechanosensitive channel